ncbi:hypothetical protein U1Q18_048080 [Sarracenia purpurea var. burkii]
MEEATMKDKQTTFDGQRKDEATMIEGVSEEEAMMEEDKEAIERRGSSEPKLVIDDPHLAVAIVRQEK